MQRAKAASTSAAISSNPQIRLSPWRWRGKKTGTQTQCSPNIQRQQQQQQQRTELHTHHDGEVPGADVLRQSAVVVRRHGHHVVLQPGRMSAGGRDRRTPAVMGSVQIAGRCHL